MRENYNQDQTVISYEQTRQSTNTNELFFGIDKFHHTSADANNGLGEVVRWLMKKMTYWGKKEIPSLIRQGGDSYISRDAFWAV